MMPDKDQLPCVIDTRWHTYADDGTCPSLLATDYKEPKAVVDPCPTLDASYPGKQNNQDVTKFVCYENHGQDSRIRETGEVAPSIPAQAGTGGNNLPLVQKVFALDSMASNAMKSKNPHSGCREIDVAKTLDTTNPSPSKNQGGMAIVEEAVAIAENVIGRKVENGGNGVGAKEGVCYTLDTVGVHGVCYPIDMMNVDGRGERYKAKCYDRPDSAAYSLTKRRPSGVCLPGVVRRLVPVECERLMGFPRIVTGDVSEMTKDEYIVWLLMTRRIAVNCEAGEVFSMRTGGGNPCPPRRLKGTVLNGYRVVSLREGDTKKQCRVHRIVWIARNGLIPEGHVVDHVNNDKLDNRIANLQLLTSAENSTKAAEDGLYRSGQDNPSAKLTDQEVEWIFDDYWCGGGSIRELAERYGISKSRVHQIIHSEDWTMIPWRGKPAEQCPDGPRYKALGNSMCTNVMAWIGERIAACENEK